MRRLCLILAACGATAACTPPPTGPAPLPAAWAPSPPPPPAPLKSANVARAPLDRLPLGLAEGVILPGRTALRLDEAIHDPVRPGAAARSLGLSQLASQHRGDGREEAALRAAGAAHALAVQAFGPDHPQTRAAFLMVAELSNEIRHGRSRMRRLAVAARTHRS